MRALLRFVKPLWTRANDWFLNIHTTPVRELRPRYDDRPWWRGERTVASVHDDNKAFASPDYHYIRKVRSLLHLRPSDVLYDLGSGTGRFLCVFAREKIRGCVGIELFQPLCEIARDNATRLRGRKVPITVRCGDAASADMADGTIYLMFNPFGAETMHDVLSNI